MILKDAKLKHSQGPVYNMSLYAFHLGQIVLGQVDHDGQHGNAARTPIRDETSETDHTRKRHFCHSAIHQTIKTLAILRCLYGSEMVVLGVVIGKCCMPSTDIHKKMTMQYSWSNVNLCLASSDKQQWTYITFFPKSFL